MFLLRFVIRVIRIIFDTVLFLVLAGLFIIALLMGIAILFLVFF